MRAALVAAWTPMLPQTVKTLVKAGGSVSGCVVNVLGLTFKENCPDLRNSKVIDIIRELKEYGMTVHVHDPYVSSAEAEHEYDIALTEWGALPVADAVVLAVAHHEYLNMPLTSLTAKVKAAGSMIDVKSVLDRGKLHTAGIAVWRL